MASARPLSKLLEPSPYPPPVIHHGAEVPLCIHTYIHVRPHLFHPFFYSPISVLSRPALRHSHMYGLSGFGEVEISL